MPIGPKILLKLVKEKKLVENLCERELKNPEGAGFDLRLGEVYEIKGKGFLGVDERKTSDAKLVKKFQKDKKISIIIKPGEQYLVSTLEIVNMPKDITANFSLRGTLYRSGIILSGGNIAPSYSGNLSFTLFNCGKCSVEVELGARIVHIMFFRIEGKGSSYRGQWRGGRVLMKKKEKQV
ncbi:hypothetical protein KKB40_04650 [Patescibacteria group bacterium]|nr:hypothetical protein [Patescibacteria group bacterium]